MQSSRVHGDDLVVVKSVHTSCLLTLDEVNGRTESGALLNADVCPFRILETGWNAVSRVTSIGFLCFPCDQQRPRQTTTAW